MLFRSIADAQLESTRDAGAEVAFMNPGGIRVPIDYTGDGVVTYSALYAVQPFGNHLVTMTLSGKELLQLLEQQWSVNGLRRLQISKGSGFAWNPDQPEGHVSCLIVSSSMESRYNWSATTGLRSITTLPRVAIICPCCVGDVSAPRACSIWMHWWFTLGGEWRLLQKWIAG